jgi:hypothetical protein
LSSRLTLLVLVVIQGIIFGGMIGLFATDISTQDGRGELRSGGDRYALYCFIVAIGTFP